MVIQINVRQIIWLPKPESLRLKRDIESVWGYEYVFCVKEIESELEKPQQKGVNGMYEDA